MPAITPAAFPAAGTILTAAEYNKLPRGLVFQNTITAAQNGLTTAVTDLTNFTATWTATSTRYYRTVIFIPEILQNTGNGTFSLYIADGAGTQITRTYHQNTTGEQLGIICEIVETGLSGSVTRKGRGSVTANTYDVKCSATQVGIITVEDLGGT